MKEPFLSRTECTALRGIAILGIILHNYCHWLRPAVKENEYLFKLSNSEALWNAVSHPDWLLPVHLFSYFGHYGVPIFLFLSGYGLVLKYEQGQVVLPGKSTWRSALSFIGNHWLKLFKIMLPGFIAFAIIDRITPNAWHYEAENIVALLTMVINILPAPNTIIWPGPYWFFGLMLQLYIVYRLFFYCRHWAVAVAFVVLCWFLQISCSPDGTSLNSLRYNCIGGMMPFCFGLLIARFNPHPTHRLNRSIYAIHFVAMILIIFLMCWSFQTWLWIPLFVILCCYCLIKILPQSILKPLVWVGTISALIFVIHPIFRKIFIPLSHNGDVYAGAILYLLATIYVAWLSKIIDNKIHAPKQ